MQLVTISFTYTGATQNFTVPLVVSPITIKAWGAGGGNVGGPGGYATGSVSATQGDTINMVVGQGGITRSFTYSFGGGGPAGSNPYDGFTGSSGGGASIVYRNTSTLLLVAGGGGGGGGAIGYSIGGSGGGLTGTTAFVTNTGNTGGTGGTQTTGGAAGVNIVSGAGNGTAGTSFRGGIGGPTNTSNRGSGGGGGGGYFGGGGGAGQQDPNNQETSGGGGSSYIGGVTGGSTLSTPQSTATSPQPNPPNTTDPSYIAGVGVGNTGGFGNGGNGLVVLSYTIPTLIKTVDKIYAAVGDTINYTLVLDNTSNTTINNIVFVDTIPNGTTFVAGSLKVNNTPVAGSPNPPGVSLGNIARVITITYSVVVTTIPTSNPIINRGAISGTNFPSSNSNTVATTVNYLLLSSTKVVNKNFADIGDTLNYTIIIRNTGNTAATNNVFIDTIPNGTTLIPNTFKQDNTPITGSPTPPGVTLPNAVAAGGVTTITFQVKVNTLPSPNPIVNTSAVTGSYIIDGTTTPVRTATATSNSNSVNTLIYNASLSSASKRVDKAYANCGDTLQYTIVIPNIGSATAVNVILKDTIPTGTVFVSDSVRVNDIQQLGANPQTGITVGAIPPNAITTVTFAVKVQC